MESYFHGPLHVLFSLLSVERCKESIRKAIPEDAQVLVFGIEGTLFSTKNPVYELERVEARRLYEKYASKDSPDTLANAFTKHLSVTKLFAKECNIPPKKYFDKKMKIRYDKYLQKDERLKAKLLKAKKEGYSLVVWSNNNRVITRRILSLLLIENVFDIIFYSVDDGEESFMQKPLAEANELLYKLMNVRTREQIIVFDVSLATVDSSRKSGFKGVLVDRREGIATTLEDFLLSGDLHTGIHSNDRVIGVPYGMNDERMINKKKQ